MIKSCCRLWQMSQGQLSEKLSVKVVNSTICRRLQKLELSFKKSL